MNKAVMISIKPKWCELIASGKKPIEVRKGYPKHLLEEYYKKQSDFFRNRPSYRVKPFKCYIYCTKGKNQSETFFDTPFGWIKEKGHIRGKVIGEFVCDSILDIPSYVGSYEECQDYDISDDDLAKTCLGLGDLFNYGRGKPLYGWHISELKIYDKPKELEEFSSLSKCNSDCSYVDCFGKDCNHICSSFVGCISRPPQSWCYVEGLK